MNLDYKVLIVSHSYLEYKIELPSERWDSVTPFEHDPYRDDFSCYDIIFLDIDDSQFRVGPSSSINSIQTYTQKHRRVVAVTSARNLDYVPNFGNEKMILESGADWIQFPITEEKVKILLAEAAED